MTWNKKYMNWSFTEFKCVDFQLAMILDVPDGVDYIVYQLEKCPTTGRHHLQGYVRLLQMQTNKWLRSNLSTTAYYEPTRQSEARNLAYCTKPETREAGPFYFGITAKQTKRIIHGTTAYQRNKLLKVGTGA